MILLSGNSLARRTWFGVESMSLTLSGQDSSASLTVGPDAPEISLGDWLMDDTEPGSGIVWRVSRIENQIPGDTRTITLEHIIQTLKDNILEGTHDSSDMGGTDEGVDAETAARYVLARQNIWTLGTFGYTMTAPFKFEGDSLMEALRTISSALDNPVWTFDCTSLPFVLNIQPADSAASCEMRETRNLSTLRRTIDRSRMYTRLYPIGEDGIELPEKYIQQNTQTYGIIERVETDSSQSSVSSLRFWAQKRLAKHSAPAVTITISGLELSQSTGEALDRLEYGRICRVPLPEYDTTIEEQITRLQWRDKIADPEGVTVTLANNQEDVASILREQMNSTVSASRSGRVGAKKAEEDHAWFVDTTDHVAMVAEAVAGEGASTDWSRVAQVMVDGKGVHQRVTEAEGDLITHEARIEVTEQSIQQEVTARGQQGELLHSEIMQTATQIYQYVENEADDMRSEIRQTASRITLAVEKKSDNFFQFDDPKTSPPEGKKVTEGSIWVKSNDIRHYGDAEVFTWGDLGGYAWADFYGSEIYIWENGEWKLAGSDQLANINRTRIDQTDEHIALIADNFDGNWSAFVVEAGRIRSEVNSIKSDMGSIVEQTADMIRTAVFTANSTLYSEIKQTATQIYSHIEDENNGLHSEINQTVSSIRTEVGTKSRVFRQWTNPVYDDATRPDGYHVQAGDFWVVDNEIHTYGQAETKTYGQLSQFDWKSFYGCTFYVYDGATWVKVSDDQLTQINHTYGEETRDRFYRVAEDAAHNRAELELTKSQFRTEINTAKNEFGSSITQTAREIRSEVHAGQSTLYSEIRQTATSIMLHVANTASGLESKITVHSNKISLLVDDTTGKIKPASIVAAINDGESSVVISADHINLDGLVRTSDLTANYLITKIGMATQVNTQRLNANTVTILPDGFQSSINVATGIKEVQISGPTSNTYKLQYKRYNQTSWQDAGSFSRAVSSWNVAGAGGKITVTASPQNQSREVALNVDGSSTITSNGTYTFKAQYQNMSGQYADTGASKSVTVNVSSSAGSISIDPVSGSSSASGTFARRISDLVASYNKYVIFTVNCTCGASHKYYIETPT